MSNLNKSLIGDLQTKTLQEKIISAITVVDLNWLGYDHLSGLSPSTIEKYNVQAHINRVMLWLSSKPNDYVRESLKGGILYTLLGESMSDENLASKEELLKVRFSDEFANDLDLIYLKLTRSTVGRGLIVNMIVRDRLVNITIPISAEVAA